VGDTYDRGDIRPGVKRVNSLAKQIPGKKGGEETRGVSCWVRNAKQGGRENKANRDRGLAGWVDGSPSVKLDKGSSIRMKMEEKIEKVENGKSTFLGYRDPKCGREEQDVSSYVQDEQNAGRRASNDQQTGTRGGVLKKGLRTCKYGGGGRGWAHLS